MFKAKLGLEVHPNFSSLVLPYKPVINEHTMQFLSDSLVQQGGSNRAIHPSGNPHNHAIAPNVLLNLANKLWNQLANVPAFLRLAHAKNKIIEELHPIQRVHNFRVELNSIKLQPPIL